MSSEDAQSEDTGNIETPGECNYTHDLPNKTWKCPHEAPAGSNRCLFHQPISEKRDEAVTEAFLDCANSSGQRIKQFVGATFGEMDIEYTTIDADDNYPLLLTEAEFTGEVTWSFAVIRQPIHAQRTAFATKTEVSDIDFGEIFQANEETAVDRDVEISAPNYFEDGFEGGAAFPEVSFNGGIDFRGTTFDGNVRADGAKFYGVADLWGTRFRSSLSVVGCGFQCGILLDGAVFEGVADFSESTINVGCVLERATARQEFLLTETTIEGDCILSHMNFGADASFEQTRIRGTLNLEGSTFEGRSHSINMRDITIDGELNWSFSTVKQPLHLQGATVAAKTDVDNTDIEDLFDDDGGLSDVFEGGSSFPDVGFDGGADFRGTTFEQTVMCQQVTFHGVADFWGTEFHRGGSMDHCEFEHGLLFDGAEFGDVMEFSNITLQNVGVFERVTCEGEFVMFDSNLHGDCVFANAEFHGDATFSRSQFTESVDFSGSIFHETATFEGMQCLKRATFVGARSRGRLVMKPETGTDDIMHVDLSETVITDGLLAQPTNGDVIYDLREATLGTVKLGRCSDHPLFDHFRFENTRFNEFDFAYVREDLSDAGWQIHDTVETRDDRHIPDDYSTLETTYLLAKNSASDVGESKAAAEFFRQEMNFRRKDHWATLTGRKNDTEAGVKHRSIAGGKWLANTALMFTSGYGERPWRVVATAAASIAIFAVVFAGLLSYAPYGGWLGYLILSTESFITLVLGGSPSIRNEFVRLIAGLEGFIGAFLMALFVFTLTRSIER